MDSHLYQSSHIEGDYIETVDGLFFAVKGLYHPKGKVIAYLRYIPDSKGERNRGGVNYRRVYSIGETTEFLRKHHPEYLSFIESLDLTLQTVPLSRIDRSYNPRERLVELIANPRTKLEKTIARFASVLSTESNIPVGEIGVSGSILIGLESLGSDVDLLVYGREEGLKANKALRRLRDVYGWVSSYDGRTVEKVLKARWSDTGLDLERFRGIEVRKKLHGLVCDRDYFVRLVKRPEEVEAEIESKPLRRARIRAIISDGSDAIFTPCTYQIQDCTLLDAPTCYEVSELVSFRGKFTEQASEGDAVEAYGTLEQVKFRDRVVHRLMMGSEGDYLIPVEKLDR